MESSKNLSRIPLVDLPKHVPAGKYTLVVSDLVKSRGFFGYLTEPSASYMGILWADRWIVPLPFGL